MDVRVLEEDFHDGVVVNGPDFEIRRDVRGIAGFDEVDFVRSIFMIAAGARVGGVSLVEQQGIRFDFTSWIQVSRPVSGVSGGKYGRYTFVIVVTEMRLR